MFFIRLSFICLSILVTSHWAWATQPGFELVGPDGDVVLFINNGSSIVLKQCVPHSLTTGQSECEQRSDKPVFNVPTSEIKTHLRNVLRLSINGFSEQTQRLIKLANKSEPEDSSALERQRSKLVESIARIDSFIERHGPESANLSERARFEEQLAQLEQTIADNTTSAIEWAKQDVDARIDRVTEQWLKTTGVRRLLHGDAMNRFEFNLLKNYVRYAEAFPHFVTIPAGAFAMGSPKNEPKRSADEKQRHVTISRSFQMQTTEVTQAQYYFVMGNNPAAFKWDTICSDGYILNQDVQMCANHPIEKVSWEDTQEFIHRLNQLNDGYEYRLPTAAEWEYAARAGSTTAYFFGDDSGQLSSFSWSLSNGGNRSHPVGQKKPNTFGLFDMYGNVAEWVQDFYGSYDSSAVVDPQGPSHGTEREVRGCGFASIERYCRSATRIRSTPDTRWNVIGFRLVRTPK